MSKERVLFLCTSNRCRSQMAEAMVNHDLGDRFEAFSAGTAPKTPHPLALKVLAELGIEHKNARSKHMDEFVNERFDHVITLCDSANETCPIFLGSTKRTHISFDDPDKAIGTEEEILAAFRRVRDEIRIKVESYLTSEAFGMNPSASRRVPLVPSLGHVFISFLRLGLTAFGGPAMVVYIRKMSVTQKHWLDGESFQDGVAFCQVVPGATAMQTAAYVGLKVRGIVGAAASFIGFGLPAFFFMMALSALYAHMHALPKVVSVFNGLQAIVVAIVANATVSFGRASLKNLRHAIIASIAAGMFGLGVSPILVVLLAAVLGFVLNNRQIITGPAAGHSGRMLRTTPALLLLLSATFVGFLLLILTQKRLFDLAFLMSKIDLFAFGGGFASVPLMYHEIVEVRSWMDAPTFLNGIVLGQLTPGPIVITATFVGYLVHGPLGGIVATVAIFLPSFLMVVGIAPYFDRLRSSVSFQRAIKGILCSFVGLLLTVTIRFGLNIHWDSPRILLASGAFAALLLKVDILWVVAIATLVSLLVL